jgi:hypothetical protein
VSFKWIGGGSGDASAEGVGKNVRGLRASIRTGTKRAESSPD